MSTLLLHRGLRRITCIYCLRGRGFRFRHPLSGKKDDEERRFLILYSWVIESRDYKKSTIIIITNSITVAYCLVSAFLCTSIIFIIYDGSSSRTLLMTGIGIIKLHKLSCQASRRTRHSTRHGVYSNIRSLMIFFLNYSATMLRITAKIPQNLFAHLSTCQTP